MMNLYKELEDRQCKEFNNFPLMFAFSNEQFDEGMKKFGLDSKDTNKILSIGGGGYIRETDALAFNEMNSRHKKEMNLSIENDKTGEDFIYDMFYYELNNHEYCITYEVEDTLDALGLTVKEVNANKILLLTLNRACRDIRQEVSED